MNFYPSEPNTNATILYSCRIQHFGAYYVTRLGVSGSQQSVQRGQADAAVIEPLFEVCAQQRRLFKGQYSQIGLQLVLASRQSARYCRGDLPYCAQDPREPKRKSQRAQYCQAALSRHSKVEAWQREYGPAHWWLEEPTTSERISIATAIQRPSY